MPQSHNFSFITYFVAEFILPVGVRPVQEVGEHVGEGQATAGRGVRQKAEDRLDAVLRQILRDGLKDEECHRVFDVSVPSQCIAKGLPIEVDGHEGDVFRDIAERRLEGGALRRDVLRLVDLPCLHRRKFLQAIGAGVEPRAQVDHCLDLTGRRQAASRRCSVCEP